MAEHALDHFATQEGGVVAVCGCGWESTPCPDATEAANFWGQHLLQEADDG